MSVKRAAQTVAVWCDNIICVTINAIFSKNLWHNSIIQTQEQSNMTTWAIQPSHFGNEVKIWADVFHADHFSEAKRQAERQAELLGEPITIWKVGTISEFKWMEVK